MPTPDYALTMASYNLWQNKNLTDAASSLTALERQNDRVAFFGSIEKTFSHLFWGDQIWLSRYGYAKEQVQEFNRHAFLTTKLNTVGKYMQC
jgi:uncharacterized damage-inducible protein DinB